VLQILNVCAFTKTTKSRTVFSGANVRNEA
jgi:hypothetical protein